MSTLASNSELAARAAAAADSAKRGSTAWRAWRSLAAVLRMTPTAAEAAKFLASLHQGDVQDAALRYLAAIRHESPDNT